MAPRPLTADLQPSNGRREVPRRPWVHRERADLGAEELANAVTHGIAAAASIAACIVLVVLAVGRGNPRQIVTLSVFGAALVAVYCVSTLYHACRRPALKSWLQVCDHIAIYFLIAGTYTPLMLVRLGGGWGWSLFAVNWALAVMGMCLTLACRERFRRLSIAHYLAMGWLALVGAPVVFAALSGSGLAWLLAGGIIYSLGVVFYLWDDLQFNHAIWHLFVMAGSACHVVTMWTDVL